MNTTASGTDKSRGGHSRSLLPISNLPPASSSRAETNKIDRWHRLITGVTDQLNAPVLVEDGPHWVVSHAAHRSEVGEVWLDSLAAGNVPLHARASTLQRPINRTLAQRPEAPLFGIGGEWSVARLG